MRPSDAEVLKESYIEKQDRMQMSECETCYWRKLFAKTFDMHWLGADDCPLARRCELHPLFREKEVANEDDLP